MRWIGIDPGAKGAVVVLPEGTIFDTPTAMMDSKGSRRVYLLGEMVEILRPYVGESVACLEAVKPVPGPLAVSLAKVMHNMGQWEGILATLGIPFDLVDPKKWKPAMGVYGDKDASRARAQQLFPQLVSHLTAKGNDGRADAALLAEYRRRLG